MSDPRRPGTPAQQPNETQAQYDARIAAEKAPSDAAAVEAERQRKVAAGQNPAR